MTNPSTRKSWSPSVVGAAIGILSWFAFATADHPIGITTAYEHPAVLAGKAAPQVEQSNGYDAAKAEEGKPPKICREPRCPTRSASPPGRSLPG
jgi:hypothetical protein